jgi:xylulose-5-phosphate/fructose-6-phosphate phosphoketolase
MTVKNQVSRYHLVADAIHNAGRTPPGSAELLTWCQAKLDQHHAYVVEHLEDMPEVKEWTLPARS